MLTLVQRYTLISLNAQDSLHMTTAKKCALKCISAAVILEKCIQSGSTDFTTPTQLTPTTPESPLYEEIVLEAIGFSAASEAPIDQWIKKASMIPGKALKRLEQSAADSLRGLSLLEEVPNLLACDLYYTSSGVSLKEYRSNETEYDREVEALKAVLMEGYLPEPQDIAMVWLLNESGCLSDLFSKAELKRIFSIINHWFKTEPFAKELFQLHIPKGVDLAAKSFLDAKKQVVATKTGTGVNFVFPFLERSQSVFIETEQWMSNPQKRLWDVVERLEGNGHKVRVMADGKVQLLKIDNLLYEAVPTAVYTKIPISGVRLRRYQI